MAQPISPPWRLAVFLLASTVGVLGLQLLHSAVSGVIPVAARPASLTAVLAGGLLVGHWWTFRLVEPRGWSYVGLGRSALSARAIGTGAAAGAAAIAVPAVILFAVGWLRLSPAETGSRIAAGTAALGLLLPASLWEELFVRGFAFAVLRERRGTYWAIGVTSLLFGGLHLMNQGATVLSVAVVTLAGVFLGLVLVRTGSLYAAWAAHLAWNVVLVIGLHAAVSGIELPMPGYRLMDSGPDWATGGQWGPEGGVFAAVGLAVMIWVMSRRQVRRLEDGA